MIKGKLNFDSAFPLTFEYEENNVHQVQVYPGMSKRLFIATMAMQGLSAMHSSRTDIDNEWICKTAFNMADELLKQENNE